MNDWIKSLPSDITPDDACEAYTNIILECAEENIPKKVVCKYSKPFMNTNLKLLQNKIKKLRKSYHKRSDPHNWNALQAALKEYITAYDQAKKSWWSDFCNKVNCNDNKFWKTIDSVLNGNTKCAIQTMIRADGSYEFDDKEIGTMLENTHIRRSNTDNSDFDDDFYNNVNQTITVPIESERHLPSSGSLKHFEPSNVDIAASHVRSSIISVRGKHTPGPDNILPKMVYEAEDALIEPTTKLFQLCWENGVNPSLWNKDNKIYIPKPGKDNYNHPKSYRPISLTSVVGKMFERIINMRLI